MLDIALKEWAVVCDLLLEGRLALLLRKGGIAETGGAGVFELEHQRFALFPSWAHQKPQMVKPPLRERVEMLDEPAKIALRGIGHAAHIWRVTSREAFDSLNDLHCWSDEYVNMRFDYKPDRPLYLIAVRVYCLTEPKMIDFHAAYAGCRSWVPLRPGDEVDDAGAQPAIDDVAFNTIVTRINAVLG